jgi:small GTP-binding protein
MEQIINSYKIIVAGDTGTGKSSLILKFTENSFSGSFNSTIGVDFRMKTFTVNGKTVRLYIWDTAGQERFRSITRSYYTTAEAIILAFDITNKETFITLPGWLEELAQYEKTDAPIVLVGTKSDRHADRKVHQSEIDAFIENYVPKFNIQYVETSAKFGRCVDEVFFRIGEELLKIKTVIPESMTQQHNKNQWEEISSKSIITSEDKIKQRSCCNIL